MAVKVFFSYAHPDEALRDELAKHLAVMQRSGLIQGWHDRRVDAGGEVDPTIMQALETSEIVLCLVSPDFLASHYCYEREMQRALERKRAGECEVIPVLLRPSDWLNTPLAALRSTPNDNKPVTSFANRDEAFHLITQDIRRVAERFREGRGNDRAKEPFRVPNRSPATTRGDGARDSTRPQELRAARPRVRRTFKDADRDAFLQEAFEEMARFIEAELAALEAEASHLTSKFQRIDARSFGVTIYEDGRRAASGSVWVGGGALGSSEGVYFSNSAQPTHGSFNEMLTVIDDGFEQHLKPLGLALHGRSKDRLSIEEATQFIWNLIAGPILS